MNILESSSPCVYIDKKQGEKLRKFLVGYDLLDKSKLIKVKEDFIYFPIKKNIDNIEKSQILDNFNSALFSTSKFKLREKSDTLMDIFSKHFDWNELKFIPRSLDIVGSIAILEIPSELRMKENLLAKLLLEHNKSLKSVFSKIGKVDGEFRTRELKFLAGEHNTVTIHKENGCRFELDVKKVYFSPRLSTEHARIADMINSDEIVLDMFAGIGPFSVLIAKRKGAKIYALDKNPDAIFYLKRNIILNKIKNLIVPLLGDAQKLILTSFKEKFNRIIMNLPEKSYDYLSTACYTLKPEGGIIHFYTFRTESETYKEIEERLSDEIQKHGKKINDLKFRKVKSTAPHEYQICVDIHIVSN